MSELVDFLLKRIGEDEEMALSPRHTSVGSDPWTNQRCRRTLSEVASKRHILEEVSWANDLRSDRVRRWLALPYVGHEDYREEWKP